MRMKFTTALLVQGIVLAAVTTVTVTAASPQRGLRTRSQSSSSTTTDSEYNGEPNFAAAAAPPLQTDIGSGGRDNVNDNGSGSFSPKRGTRTRSSSSEYNGEPNFAVRQTDGGGDDDEVLLERRYLPRFVVSMQSPHDMRTFDFDTPMQQIFQDMILDNYNNNNGKEVNDLLLDVHLNTDVEFRPNKDYPNDGTNIYIEMTGYLYFDYAQRENVPTKLELAEWVAYNFSAEQVKILLQELFPKEFGNKNVYDYHVIVDDEYEPGLDDDFYQHPSSASGRSSSNDKGRKWGLSLFILGSIACLCGVYFYYRKRTGELIPMLSPTSKSSIS